MKFKKIISISTTVPLHNLFNTLAILNFSSNIGIKILKFTVIHINGNGGLCYRKLRDGNDYSVSVTKKALTAQSCESLTILSA